MHQGILEIAKERPESVARVLPSYGMTECMPISTPPLAYQLQKPGTSGVSVGPEITIFDGNQQVTSIGKIGRICVRGTPVFAGYLKSVRSVDRSCFDQHGWFDTGDLGYLDEQDFLFITGRSKEVINRGGELISPLEVEEAVMSAAADLVSPIYGRVSRALAFSVQHDLLQEVVGIAITTPDNRPRTCLRDIQEALKSVLAQVKIPVVLVFMDAGLPTNNNKILRIKLAERLGLQEISGTFTHAQRHHVATCPPRNTPLTQKISCIPFETDHQELCLKCERFFPTMDALICKDLFDIYPDLHLAPRSRNVRSIPLSTETVLKPLAPTIPGFSMPQTVHILDCPFPRDELGEINESVLESLSTPGPSAKPTASLTATEATIASLFAEILNIPVDQISKSSEFFALGGSSMSAGQLLSKLRKAFRLRLPVNALFANSELENLAQLVDEHISTGKELLDHRISLLSPDPPQLVPGCEETCSSIRSFLMAVHLLPLVVFCPMKRAMTWTVFIYMLMATQSWRTSKSIPGRLLDFVISLAVGRAATKIAAPLFAIAFKMDRHGKMQRRPVANVEPISHSLVADTESQSKDNAVLERCNVRPFAPERNTSFYLGRIVIGTHAVVGLSAIVAPGTVVPAHASLGPDSSSWEVDDADEANRDLASSRVQGAHWALNLLFGLPSQLTVTFIGSLPWLGGLTALVAHDLSKDTDDIFREVIIWFASTNRVGYHYFALSLNAVLAPAFVFLAVYMVKRCFDLLAGPVKLGSGSHFQISRADIMRRLMPAPQLHKLAGLFGTHYEATSILARMMGARIGRHVYWPGTGLSVQDWSLLDIGNDVVFGSRSHLVTADGTGSERIRIGDRAMVADRVVLLPGVQLGEGTVMGSGALTKCNACYRSNTTWVGAKAGEAICLSDAAKRNIGGPGQRLSQYYNQSHGLSSSTSTRLFPGVNPLSEASSITMVELGSRSAASLSGSKPSSGVKLPFVVEQQSLTPWASTIDLAQPPTPSDIIVSPFGRAFYLGQAPYRVWSQLTIFCHSTAITLITAVYWNIASISAVQVVAWAYKHDIPLSRSALADEWYRPVNLYFVFSALIVAIMAMQSLLVLMFLVGCKRLLMGTRKQGKYDWDKSPYCQRWQLFLKLEMLRRQCYGGHGILGLVTGTHSIVMYFRAMGLKCGENCALFAGGLPSLYLTKPDLLTLGDRVSVDDASLVGHINTRGKFDLNPLHVGDTSVLRTGSRLLSGARMEADSCSLEHTLIMAGDVVEAGATMQGWPAEEFHKSRMPTMKVDRVWKVGT